MRAQIIPEPPPNLRTRIVHAFEVSESSCARKLRYRKPSLFNAFEIFDHMPSFLQSSKRTIIYPSIVYSEKQADRGRVIVLSRRLPVEFLIASQGLRYPKLADGLLTPSPASKFLVQDSTRYELGMP